MGMRVDKININYAYEINNLQKSCLSLCISHNTLFKV